MNLLDLLTSTMTSSSSVDALAEKTGEQSSSIKKLLMLALPLFILYMTRNASSKEGAGSLADALTQHQKTGAVEDQIADFKEQINLELKPLKEEVKNLREDLKSKGRTVHEKVYRFLDEEERMVGFYNSEGMLVSSRPARRDELQKTVFAEMRKEGTNN